MSLLSLIVIIVLVGVLLWAINQFIPMDSKVKNILNAVVVIVLVLWLLRVFGILGAAGNIRVGEATAPQECFKTVAHADRARLLASHQG